MSSTSSWWHASPCSSSTSRPIWEGVAGEREQEEGADCSHTLLHGAPGSAAHLQACPGHESSTLGRNHHPGHRGKLARD